MFACWHVADIETTVFLSLHAFSSAHVPVRILDCSVKGSLLRRISKQFSHYSNSAPTAAARADVLNTIKLLHVEETFKG